MTEYKLLNDLTECPESFRDLNTTVKIIFPKFSPGRFTPLCVPFQTLPSLMSRSHRKGAPYSQVMGGSYSTEGIGPSR